MPEHKVLRERSQQAQQTIHRLVLHPLSDAMKKASAAASAMKDATDSTDNGFEEVADIHLQFAAKVCDDIKAGIEKSRLCVKSFRDEFVETGRESTPATAAPPAQPVTTSTPWVKKE